MFLNPVHNLMTKMPTTSALETRENLLQLAARLFRTNGYSATSMRSIASQAGIEAASIYYHFDSKEALAEAVMAHGADSIVRQLTSHLEALPLTANAETRFRAAVNGYTIGLIKFGDYALGHNSLLVQLPENVQLRHIARRERHQELWTTLIDDLRIEGVLREDVDVHLCRIFLLGSINTLPMWFDPEKGSLEAVADHVCTIFLEGVKRRKSSLPKTRK